MTMSPGERIYNDDSGVGVEIFDPGTFSELVKVEVYRNSTTNVYVCLTCYDNMTDAMKIVLLLEPALETRTSNSPSLYCDLCRRSCMQQIDGGLRLSCGRGRCVGIPLRLPKFECPGCVFNIGSRGRLDAKKVTRDAVCHLLLAEQAFRLTPEVQAFYSELRRQAPLMITEDFVQRAVMAAHGGYSSAREETQSLEKISANSVCIPEEYDDLGAYRQAIALHTDDEQIRSQVFFLRNNIVVPHAELGTKVNEGIALHSVSGCGSSLPRGAALTMGNLLDAARDAGNKPLVLLCGSFS